MPDVGAVRQLLPAQRGDSRIGSIVVDLRSLGGQVYTPIAISNTSAMFLASPTAIITIAA